MSSMNDPGLVCLIICFSYVKSSLLSMTEAWIVHGGHSSLQNIWRRSESLQAVCLHTEKTNNAQRQLPQTVRTERERRSRPELHNSSPFPHQDLPILHPNSSRSPTHKERKRLHHLSGDQAPSCPSPYSKTKPVKIKYRKKWETK